MAKQWLILMMITLLASAGCQNCGQAAREAEEAASMAAEGAQAAEQAAEQAAREAAEREAAEREAAERAAREAAERAAAEAARRHVVIPGDCLWCIAEDRWGDGFRWSEIYEANRDQIKDPDLIYPDQIFTIPQGG